MEIIFIIYLKGINVDRQEAKGEGNFQEIKCLEALPDLEPLFIQPIHF